MSMLFQQETAMLGIAALTQFDLLHSFGIGRDMQATTDIHDMFVLMCIRMLVEQETAMLAYRKRQCNRQHPF